MSADVWQCRRTGDCCRLVPALAMTAAEQRVLLEHPSATGRLLIWSPQVGTNLVLLKAHPCPFLDGSTCSVYESRPYNCRRSACGRRDVRREPLELSDRGPIFFKAADERFWSERPFRRLMARMMARAQKWGAAHGWRE